MVKIAVNGALGRMGNRILHLAYASNEFKIVGGFEHAKHEALGKDLGTALGFGKALGVTVERLSGKHLKGADVLIDFSSSEGASLSLSSAVEAKAGLVVGTTGIDERGAAKIREASKVIPIVFSPNMSIGANFLFELARLAASRLGAGYDIEIVEAHHRLKKDAPSGTAKKIAEVIAEARGWKLDKVARYGRQGLTGERPKDELGIHVIRAGDIVGEHTVYFSGPGETIEITHRAQSRDAFARGALVAALFLKKKRPGLYGMKEVLEG